MIGVLPFLLPELELNMVSDKLNKDQSLQTPPVSLFDVEKWGAEWFWRADSWQYAQTKIPGFLCPSDDAERVSDPYIFNENPWILNSSCSNSGTSTQYCYYLGVRFGTTQGDVLGRTNYLGVAGRWGPAVGYAESQFEGAFSHRSKTDFAHMCDGSSNVFMFGESMGGEDRSASPPTRRSYTWIGSGVMITNPGLPLNDQQARWYHFSSRHPGIVQFCLGDGSVRPISTTIKQDTTPAGTNVYWNLTGMRDGYSSSVP
jgi:hypothetical protein